MDAKNDDKLNQIINKLTEQVVGSVNEIVTQNLAAELDKALRKALKEGDFFRRINHDMRRGFQDIYQEIKSVKDMAPSATAKPQDAKKLFSEATGQLDEIMTATEKATEQIMDIVEKHQDMINKSGQMIDAFRTGGAKKESVDDLHVMTDALKQDFMNIMTALSFQDLTGQRIKRIVQALKRIEEIVYNVYMTTGLAEKARDQEPELDTDEITAQAQQRVSELKGPQKGTSQTDVDDLLKQLGME